MPVFLRILCFYAIYFDQTFSPPWTPLTYPHPYLTNFMFLYSQKQTNNKTKVNMKQKAIKNPHTQHTHNYKSKNKRKKEKEKKQTKNKNKSHGVYFVLVNSSWTWDLPWCIVDRTSVPPLQTTYFSIPRSYHLKIAFA